MKNTLIKIDFSTYLFILFSLVAGYIKHTLIIFFVVLIHEFGHILFTYLFKYKVLKVNIYPFGGYTIINKDINSSIKKDLLIALGGVVMQLIIFLFIYIFNNHINGNTYKLINKYNKLILIFNLLPIIPLDGFKIINLLLNKWFSFKRSYYLSFFIGLLSYMLFLVFLKIKRINNVLIIMFLLIELVKYLRNYKYIYNRFLLERYLKDFDYEKIDNNCQNICDLKLETLHYFKKDSKYVHERRILAKKFDNKLFF